MTADKENHEALYKEIVAIKDTILNSFQQYVHHYDEVSVKYEKIEDIGNKKTEDKRKYPSTKKQKFRNPEGIVVEMMVPCDATVKKLISMNTMFKLYLKAIRDGYVKEVKELCNKVAMETLPDIQTAIFHHYGGDILNEQGGILPIIFSYYNPKQSFQLFKNSLESELKSTTLKFEKSQGTNTLNILINAFCSWAEDVAVTIATDKMFEQKIVLTDNFLISRLVSRAILCEKPIINNLKLFLDHCKELKEKHELDQKLKKTAEKSGKKNKSAIIDYRDLDAEIFNKNDNEELLTEEFDE